MKEIKPGQKVDVVILEIDRDKHRISLSMKRCEDNHGLISQQTIRLMILLKVR